MTQCVVRNPEFFIFRFVPLAIGEGKEWHSEPGINGVRHRISFKNVVALPNVERQFGDIVL